MANLIKCKVYNSEDKFGGGNYIVPIEHVEVFEETQRDVSAAGEFMFDKDFLDTCIRLDYNDRSKENLGHYYDNTWSI